MDDIASIVSQDLKFDVVRILDKLLNINTRVAERFFGIETAALAGFYNIPYYVGLLVLRVKYSRYGNQDHK